MKAIIRVIARGRLMLLVTILTVCVASIAFGAEKKTYSFKWNNYQSPETHYEVANSGKCIKELEAAFGGRMKIKQYIGGSLLSGKETLEGLGSGVADIANYYQPYGVGLNPLFDMAGLPAVWTGSDNMMRAERSMEMIKWWDEILKPLNIKMLGLYCCGEGWIFTRKDRMVTVPSDLKGKVLRGYKMFERAIAANGGSTVMLGTGEVYEAIMRSVIHGVITNPNAALDNLWCEVAPWGVLYPFNLIEACTIMNLDSWNKLTDEDKDLLLKTTMANHAAFAKEMIAGIKPGQKTYEGLKKYATLHVPTAEETALWTKFCEPVRDDFRKSLPSDKHRQQFDNFLAIANKYK